MTTSGGASRRREWLYLLLLLLLLGSYALPLGLSRAGRSSSAAALLVEDGLYEWVAAAACLAGGFLFLAAWRSSGAGGAGLERPRRNPWALLFAVSMLALAGEELSWGQRLFGFQTPEWFLEHNRQRELTIHRLDMLGESVNAASDLGTDLLQIYLLALPLMLAAFPTLGRLARRVRVPVPPLAVAFIAGVLKYLNREAEERFALVADVSHKTAFGEIFETSLELLLLAVAVEYWLAARVGPNGADPPGERVPEGGAGG